MSFAEALAALIDPPPPPEATRHWGRPGELALALEPASLDTPALQLVDKELLHAWSTPDSRLIISMPPQEGKSHRVTEVGVLWALINNPETRIGIVSYAQTLAEGFSGQIRGWIQGFSGDEGTLDLGLRIARDNGAKSRWQLDKHRGGVVAVGVGSGLTGRPLDALIIDDPFADREQANSEYFRNRVWDWWTSVGAARLAPGAPVIVILTRWHEDDLAGRLVSPDREDAHRWRVINIPAKADHKEGLDVIGREPEEWLESARGRTPQQWEAIRITAGSRDFTALYQGKPSPDSGDVWKRQWWRRYNTMLWSQHPTIAEAYWMDCDEMIQSWDMAFKDTKGSDFVVGQVWARIGAQVYLIDQVCKRLSFTDTIVALEAMTKRWPQASLKLIEDKANGTAVMNQLRSKVPGMVPISPTESKYSRATAVSPPIEAGNVFLPTPDVALNGWDVDAFIEEAAAFPNGAHDDQVDGTSQALNRFFVGGNAGSAWLQAMKAKVGPIEPTDWRSRLHAVS